MSKVKIALIVLAIIVSLVAIYYFYQKAQNVPLEFTDNGHEGGLKGNGNLGGHLGLVMKNITSLKSGDEVDILQNAGATYPQYNGHSGVLEVFINPRGKQIVILRDKFFLGNTPPNGGTVTRTNVF